ncbi:unnamed protein product [Wuchereria bancrofti]|uniref:Uncharacterized protein n=1 Tax=Wuchereria bancrofti TaxID=6293 RepID=A0A3P7DWE9_WUCBA|nr:unnamed protein product [Wuchereria bancrofti]
MRIGRRRLSRPRNPHRRQRSSQPRSRLYGRLRYVNSDPRRNFVNFHDGRVMPNEERELIHIQHMPVNDDNDSDDDDNDNSG